MFYLKNDDMEELFRKAAENYELDAGKASDWDGIHKKLHEASEDNAAANSKKRKRRFIFWWFLLFPAGWMAHNTWDKIGSRTFNSKPVVLQQQVLTPDKGYGEGVLQPENPQLVNEKLRTIAPGNKASEKEDNKATPTPGAKKATADEAGNRKLLKAQSTLATEKNAFKTIHSKRDQQPLYIVSRQQQKLKNEKHLTPGNETPDDAVPEQPETKNGRGFYSTSQLLTASLQKVNERKFELPPLVEKAPMPPANSNAVSKHSDSLNKTSLQPAKKTSDRYFYAQAIVAPDLTNVKFQRISGVGSSVGLLVGYRFNKRFHAEAGGYWEKKVYYTKGEYFDKSKLAYFNNHKIYNVDGNCNMVTIPVNLRYNFISKKSSDWFVTAGAAAYLMQKEYYDITYEYYGDTRTKGYTYKDAPKSWLATVNIGVGYQAAVLRSFNLRVEPYLRMPVSGVGTGSLSLTSAGIYIGIGRKF